MNEMSELLRRTKEAASILTVAKICSDMDYLGRTGSVIG